MKSQFKSPLLTLICKEGTSSSLIDSIDVDYFMEKYDNAQVLLLKVLHNDIPKGYYFSQIMLYNRV